MIVQKINKVLIANRGEIAVRIIRTLDALNIDSVAVFAANDKHSWHTRLAGEAWPLGEGELSDTYLNAEKIVNIALKSGADAIHPGYGFLSESPQLIAACEKNNIIFIGPDANSIHLMGNKIEARKFAVENGLPITLGVTGNAAELLKQAPTLPFPVLVKAAAGGGGKGMRIVHQLSDLEKTLETTSREAKNYFGDGTVYIEQYIEEPRHIEVQVLGDQYGNIIHLYERECSIQRRYQKIIEESPSPTLTPEIREKMGEAAVRLCKAIGYRSAGTIEFLVDKNLNFYFLEMNTRIQVEHPVTEMVTGYDLIEEQLMVAQGFPLRIKQEEVKQNGHAIECRIYAEDPAANFLPSPGQIYLYNEPEMAQLRIDGSTNQEVEVQSFYDPLISKLIVWGETRNDAIKKAHEALQQYAIHGIKTNIAYLRQLLLQPQFIENKISTRFCDDFTPHILQIIEKEKQQAPVFPLLSAFLIHNLNKTYLSGLGTIWEEIGFWRHSMKFEVQLNEQIYMVEPHEIEAGKLKFTIASDEAAILLKSFQKGVLLFEMNEQLYKAFVSEDSEGFTLIQLDGIVHKVRRMDQMLHILGESSPEGGEETGDLFAPMPGKVIHVNVKVGEKVSRGAILLVVEAMKMENNILSPGEAIVESINVKAGDMVDTKTQLIHLKEV